MSPIAQLQYSTRSENLIAFDPEVISISYYRHGMYKLRLFGTRNLSNMKLKVNLVSGIECPYFLPRISSQYYGTWKIKLVITVSSGQYVITAKDTYGLIKYVISFKLS